MSKSASEISGTASYDGDIPAQQNDDDTEEVSFSYTFENKSTLIGTAKATLWMFCPDHTDFDVFTQIRKADSSGKVLLNVNIPLEEPESHPRMRWTPSMC
jgi:uncharacterized protein